MEFLWTFENKEKAEKFTAILTEAGISFELQNKGKIKAQSGVVSIYVEHDDYTRAKKILTNFRRRRPSA